MKLLCASLSTLLVVLTLSGQVRQKGCAPLPKDALVAEPAFCDAISHFVESGRGGFASVKGARDRIDADTKSSVYRLTAEFPKAAKAYLWVPPQGDPAYVSCEMLKGVELDSVQSQYVALAQQIRQCLGPSWTCHTRSIERRRAHVEILQVRKSGGKPSTGVDVLLTKDYSTSQGELEVQFTAAR